MEADQRLAALQQQSYPQMQRQVANGPMGNPPPFHGHHTNGAVTANGSLPGSNSQDSSILRSQNGSPMDDSPPNHILVSGSTELSATLDEVLTRSFSSISFCAFGPCTASVSIHDYWQTTVLSEVDCMRATQNHLSCAVAHAAKLDV